MRKYTKEMFVEAWNSSDTFVGVIKKLPLSGNSGGQHKIIKDTARELGLSFDHFVGQRWATGKIDPNGVAINLESILSNSVVYNNTHALKKKLWSAGLKHKKCETCGIVEWNGKPAPLCLDHINGKRSDNRIDNLRILCHNCHAQTDTFSGKNQRKTNLPI